MVSHRLDTRQVKLLVHSATPLLSVLNQLTLLYEEESKRHAVLLRRQLRRVMEDIQLIAKQARIVSFNAQVSAVRAGDAGREFSVVAKEMIAITSKIDVLVEAAVKESVA